MRTLGLFPITIFSAMAAALGFAYLKDFGAQARTVTLPQFELPPLISGVNGFTSKDLVGGKLKVINIFASWCGACQYEHPVLKKIARDRRLELVGINWKDDTGKGVEWISRNGNPYHLIGEDVTGSVGAEFGVTSAPQTVIVDSLGQVRYRHEGPLTPEVWNTIIEPVIAQIEVHS